MRELFLLRHAKSSWDDPTLDDFDRPLAERGRKAAPVMGRAMAARGWVPQAAFVSAALRARQTWRLVAGGLGGQAPRAVHDEALYMASPERLLGFLQRAPEDAGRVVLVGHNPGLEELALLLAGPASDEEALSRLREKFPTAALARFEIACPWRALAPAAAQLTHFLRPRDL